VRRRRAPAGDWTIIQRSEFGIASRLPLIWMGCRRTNLFALHKKSQWGPPAHMGRIAHPDRSHPIAAGTYNTYRITSP
jgi:hypothetical protein